MMKHIWIGVALVALALRALDLGGAHVDVGQSPDEDHVVLADPDGNELCVIPPDNQFLAGTGVVGAVNCDGTATLGRFWSAVLDWPLVWDQDEETAIQSPTVRACDISVACAGLPPGCCVCARQRRPSTVNRT